MSRLIPEVKVQPSVIFFDAAGTLFHPARSVGAVYAEAACRLGASAEADTLNTSFRRAWRAQPPRPSLAGPRPDDDRGWWRDLAVTVLRQGCAVPAGFDEAAWFDSVYRSFAQADAWMLYPDALPALDALAPWTRLAVISNFDSRLRGILSGLGLATYFEQVIISSEVGSDKPDPAIFQTALRSMKASPGACWHIGDDPVCDGAGASAAGLRSFLVDRPTRDLTQLVADFQHCTP